MDDWMKKAGPQFFTKVEAYAAAEQAKRECDAEGIDPSLSLPERVARMQDIHQGSPLMHEERERKKAYVLAQPADNFHKDLKEKLGQ